MSEEEVQVAAAAAAPDVDVAPDAASTTSETLEGEFQSVASCESTGPH